jgi:septum formation protein
MEARRIPVRLILASASPRRAELLREHGYDFTVMASPLAEPVEFPEDMSPVERAQSSSLFKAKSVAGLVGEGWVLGADTIAALGDRVFGKPSNRDDARKILQALSGTTHQVITGVTLLDASSGAKLVRHDSTKVIMRRLSDPEIEAYLDIGAWEGKAGAYGIQDEGDAFVERFEGSFTNVVGLPMELLAGMLTEFPRIAWPA